MKRVKRLVMVLAAVMLAGMISSAAFAAKKVYVPTNCTVSIWNDEKQVWEDMYQFQYTYDKKGRLKKEVYSSDDFASTTQYTWKGNFIVKYKGSSTSSKGDSKYSAVFTYKNNRRIKEVTTTKTGGSKFTVSSTYSWKNRTAKVTTKYTGGTTGKSKVKADKKNRINYKKDDYSTLTVKYYSNGNPKTEVIKDGLGCTVNYNSNGYLTSETGKSMRYTKSADGEIIGEREVSYTTVYEYVMDAATNCPKEWYETTTDSEGAVSRRRCIVSSYTKVSKARKCDASGRLVGFGGQN